MIDFQFSLSLIAALCIGGIAGFLGSLMITKRMALVGGPLGHLALPGVALGIVYHFDIFWGALATIALGSLIIWLLTLQDKKLPVDAITAVVFASTVAAGFLLLPIEEAEQALIGDITAVTRFDAIMAAAIGIVFFVVIRRIYLSSVLTGISEDLAVSRGIHVKAQNFIYLVGIALVVAIEVKLVGILLTAALMAIPAAAAHNFSRTLRQYMYGSLVVGSFSAVAGVILGRVVALPTGPLIILSGTAFFLLSLFFVKK